MSRIQEREFPLKAYRDWLVQHGCSLLELTDEWMVMRYRIGPRGAHTIYRNKKGLLTFQGDTASHYDRFLAGKPVTEPITDDAEVDFSRGFTLYTDASNFHTTKAGAWAAILIGQGGVHLGAHSGALRGLVSSSTAAEGMAVANALHHFIKLGVLPRGAHVTVVSDNQAVVRRISQPHLRSRHAQQANVIGKIREIGQLHLLTLTARWVKGHQPWRVKGDASYNRACDKMAGAHSRALHEARLAEQVAA